MGYANRGFGAIIHASMGSCDPNLDPSKNDPRFVKVAEKFGMTICPPVGKWPVPKR